MILYVLVEFYTQLNMSKILRYCVAYVFHTFTVRYVRLMYSILVALSLQNFSHVQGLGSNYI